MAEPLRAGIEGGGTKYVCGVGHDPAIGLLARAEFRMADFPRPADLLGMVVEWLLDQQQQFGSFASVGLASFGPVDLDQGSPTYGFVTSTPKPGWRDTDVLGPFRLAFPGLPLGFDTDTNGAALGEHTWGAARGLDDFLYITIGTGIGAGGMARGNLLHGLVHPEIGHIALPALPADDFAGACPFHGRCWEGLCSGPAVAKRAGMPAEELPADHEAWRFEVTYVGRAIANLVLTLSPRRVILGGSVRKGGRLGEAAFFRGVRDEVRTALNGYVAHPSLLADGLDEYIVPPALGDDAGVWGAIALGRCR